MEIDKVFGVVLVEHFGSHNCTPSERFDFVYEIVYLVPWHNVTFRKVFCLVVFAFEELKKVIQRSVGVGHIEIYFFPADAVRQFREETVVQQSKGIGELPFISQLALSILELSGNSTKHLLELFILILKRWAYHSLIFEFKGELFFLFGDDLRDLGDSILFITLIPQFTILLLELFFEVIDLLLLRLHLLLAFIQIWTKFTIIWIKFTIRLLCLFQLLLQFQYLFVISSFRLFFLCLFSFGLSLHISYFSLELTLDWLKIFFLSGQSNHFLFLSFQGFF